MMNIFEGLFQSKEERERRSQEYSKKIFPYGEGQRQKIKDILYALAGKKNGAQLMMHYLLIKEAMIDSETKDYEAIAARIEKKKLIKLTPELRACVRLLIYKDLEADESLNYPTPEELKAQAAKEGGNHNG